MDDEYTQFRKWWKKLIAGIEKPHKTLAKICIGWLYAIILVWLLVIFQGVFKAGDKLEAAALLGNSFGVLNAILSVMAFMAVALSIWLTQKNASRQSAETHFFNLLESWQGVAERLTGKYGVKGIETFSVFWEELNSRIQMYCVDIKDEEDRIQSRIDMVRTGYEGTSNAKRIALGHYFRLLYHIIKYIDECKELSPSAKKGYVHILRAHMSEPELRTLLYNSYTKPSKGMHRYMKQYNMLKNMEYIPPYRIDSVIYKRIANIKIDNEEDRSERMINEMKADR